MGLIGLISKGLHMPNTSTTASPAATATDLGKKGRDFWNKFTMGIDKVGGLVHDIKSPIKVETSSKIDDSTMKKLLTSAIIIVAVIVGLKKFKIF
jgi:hypothetical protein